MEVITPAIILVLSISYLFISFFMGMLIHSSFVYETKRNLDKNSGKAWALCMIAGLGITAWMFIYGYHANFVWNTAS
jgi:hypothetical protein